MASPVINSKQSPPYSSSRRFFEVSNTSSSRLLRILLFLLASSFFWLSPASGQSAVRERQSRGDSGDWAGALHDFVETPAVPGFESQLSEQIRDDIASFHPVMDNLGDVIVTVGS